MKIFKRILLVVLLIVIALLISYFVYTGIHFKDGIVEVVEKTVEGIVTPSIAN